MPFEIDDKVICVDDSGLGVNNHIQKGGIYKINKKKMLHLGTIQMIGFDLHQHCKTECCEAQGFCGFWKSSRFNLYTGQSNKKKCDCPIDVLMHGGCTCGGA